MLSTPEGNRLSFLRQSPSVEDFRRFSQTLGYTAPQESENRRREGLIVE